MIQGKLITANSFTPQQVERLQQGFSKRLKQPVSLAPQVNPDLIGGFIAIVGGVTYDASIKSQLGEVARVIRD